MDNEPYQRSCNTCGKQIILGIDDETGKWRPWDNYDEGQKHNCRISVQATANLNKNKNAATGTVQVSKQVENISSELQQITEKLKTIENSVSVLVWELVEKHKRGGDVGGE